MLGTRSKNKAVQNGSMNGATTASGTCVIAQGTTITGKFSATEDVRLDGVIEGEVKCDKRLVMGETGRVKGTIMAADAIIMGTIEGELIVGNTIHLKSTAKIDGIIKGKSMTVDDGARYSGECNVGG
ncbi:MAG: cytoskeletal protein CcmA (bactofilin family) [Saprospiraceae bacterium]|jgi:cytoskeletal protein CcmA (bactofilin family)